MRRASIRAAAVAGVAFLSIGGAGTLRAQRGPADAVDVATVGPKVGEQIPPFSLPDQYGAMRASHALMGPKGAIVVFFRSANW